MFGIDDAIMGVMGGIGLGLQLFGASKQSEVAHKQAEVSRDMATNEQNINDLKAQQMELEGRRSQMETYRNLQRARAMGIASAVNQGASKGSGLMGGLGQATAQANWALTGINSALEFGRGVNTENKAISNDKMQMADLGAKSADAAGWASLGGALMKSAGTVGQFAAGFGGSGIQGYVPVGNYQMPTVGYRA